MRFLIGLMNPPEWATWDAACVEIRRARYRRLLALRRFVRRTRNCSSVDLFDHSITVLALDAIATELMELAMESPAERFAEGHPVRLPDDWELPDRLVDAPDEGSTCRYQFCELIVQSDAVFWKVYPKHSDDFDTQRLEFDWLARAFRRGAPPHRSRMRRRTADGAD